MSFALLAKSFGIVPIATTVTATAITIAIAIAAITTIIAS
jgi:hypothetical protein